MRSILRRTALLAALLLPPLAAQAQAPAPAATAAPASKLDAIIAAGVLKVGLTGDYKPFSFRDPQTGTFSGIDVDMAEALAKAMGVKLEVVQTSWPTLMADLMAGKYDIGMGGITINLPRLKTAFFSNAVMVAGKTPIALCANKDKFQTLAQIDQPGVTVIANPGGTNESFDRANLHAAKILVYPDNATIFEQIVQGHADLMITDGVETRLQQKLHPELCAIHPDKPFNTSELGYMLPRDVPLKLFVDEFLREADRTGAHAAIVSKWLD
ncbi:MAG: transporter substrate-binding domain-containing protein [Proteobacteria bacterium]|nr:transporter substrate-binding domain-containing protein [Pseudomonadota bacterium]